MVIFDLDGTLWNSSANVAASWNVALLKIALHTLKNLVTMWRRAENGEKAAESNMT